MTIGTSTLLTLHPTAASGRPLATVGRLPVDGVAGAEELLRRHRGAGEMFDDEDGLRARRREALLHRLELDRQRRRRRTA